MSYVQIIVESIVQGVTELFPISSSGHTLLISQYFNWDTPQSLLAFLHLASASGLTLYYRKRIWKMLTKLDIDYIVKIVIAGLPVIIIGILFGDYLEEIFYNPITIGINLLFWGVLMVSVESVKVKQVGLTKINAFILGIVQILSLLPGTSRSGTVLVTGTTLGIERKKLLDFTFLLGIPLLFGAGLYTLLKGDISEVMNLEGIAYFTVTAIATYLSVSVLYSIREKKFLTFFGLYRILLGIIVILLFS